MRAAGVEPEPADAGRRRRTSGRASNPATNTATYTPAAAHPQSVNQDYYVSWNNKQAKDFGAADGNFSFGAVHRGDLLDAPVKAAAGRPGRSSTGPALTSLVAATPALTDLRGIEVLDDAAPGDRQPAGHRPGAGRRGRPS